MADWEEPPAHEIGESADDAAGVPLADDRLPAENPAPAPGTAPPEAAESSAVHDVDEPPFLSRPAEPPAELDSMPDDLRALRESLEQPTGSMSPVDVEAAAAQVQASFEGTPWPTAAGDLQPAEETAQSPQTAVQPAEDPAASEATTSWEALVAAAAAEATATADVAAVSPVVAETAVSTDDAENLGTTEGEIAAEPPGEDQGAEGEPTEGEAAAQPVEGEASLDDMAPGTVAAGEAEEDEEGEEAEELAAAPVTKVSWWPFVGYLVVWLGAAGYSVWQLRETPIGQGVYETNLYRMGMLGGLSLLAAGPALLLIVWLASWIGRKNRRIGAMFISALVKGATATLLGAIIWIGAIVLVDYLRFGRPF